jgi:hypothetical protein
MRPKYIASLNQLPSTMPLQQQLQERLFVVVQFLIIHVSVPVLLWGLYVYAIAQRSVGRGGSSSSCCWGVAAADKDLELTPEQWEGGIVTSDEFDKEEEPESK